MLSRISIDIVEMVIVKSDRYNLFEILQKILLKLNEVNRKIRIKDKLTSRYITTDTIFYKLNDMFHREYDKPSFIGINLNYVSYMYQIKGRYIRKNGPARVSVNKREYGDVNTFYCNIDWIDLSFRSYIVNKLDV